MPYLNVTGKCEGVPDPGLLQEKGGRGFPYCVLMSAAGDVLWEVRPSTRDALQAGIERAGWLLELRERARAAPEDAGLAASVELLDGLGREQRPLLRREKMEELLAVAGIDERVQRLGGERVAELRYRERVDPLLIQTKDQAAQAQAFFALYQEGLRPPPGATSAITFWSQATRGAVAAKDAAAAKACLAATESLCASGNFGPRAPAMLEELRAAVAGLGRE